MAECRLSAASVVADVGSGSGQLARMFLGRVQTVFAVEPNEAMRRTAEAALADHPGFVSVAGNAESTGLAAGTVDCLTAAQAFHWFDVARFAREARRILRPEGRAALVWNVRRDAASEFQLEYKRVILRHCGERHLITERRDDPERLAVFFGRSDYARRCFDNRQSLDFPSFVGRVCSSSYAPRPGDHAYDPLIADLRSLFDRYSRDGRVCLEYETRAYVARLDN